MYNNAFADFQYVDRNLFFTALNYTGTFLFQSALFTFYRYNVYDFANMYTAQLFLALNMLSCVQKNVIH